MRGTGLRCRPAKPVMKGGPRIAPSQGARENRVGEHPHRLVTGRRAQPWWPRGANVPLGPFSLMPQPSRLGATVTDLPRDEPLLLAFAGARERAPDAPRGLLFVQLSTW